MDTVAVILGIVSVGAVLVDMGLTVLHPTIRGPIAHRLTRAVWQCVRAAAQRTARRRALAFGGPAATAALFVFWLAGLWIGFALIYLPSLAEFTTSGHLPHHGFVPALYTSGTIITTLGLGDALPGTDALRLAVVAEAVTGAAAVSATVSYVLSVYPLATQTRTQAQLASDLDLAMPKAAYEMLCAEGDSAIAEWHQQLVSGHQSLRRFPMLFYFHPGRDEESIGALLAGAVVVCAVARWAPPPALTGHGQRAARGLEMALERVRADYLARYLGGHRQQPAERTPDEAAARCALEVFAERVGQPAGDAGSAAALAAFAAHMDQLLAGVAAAHLSRHQSLLAALAGDHDSVLRSASSAV